MIEEHIEVIKKIDTQIIHTASAAIIDAYKRGNKLLAFGNGGSAADAQHFIAEMVGRFEKDRKALPGLALTANSSIVTAIANDYGYDKVFSRQLVGNAKPGDVVVGISTSGSSANVIDGLKKAKELNCVTIGLTGRGGKMKPLCDICITINSDSTARIQEAHILVIHMICREFEDAGSIS